MKNISGTSTEERFQIDKQRLKEKRHKYRKVSELAKKFKYVDYEDAFELWD